MPRIDDYRLSIDRDFVPRTGMVRPHFQCTATQRMQELHATANAYDRHHRRARLLYQRRFHRVASRAASNVFSATEEQRVNRPPPQIGHRVVGIREVRNRHETCLRKS